MDSHYCSLFNEPSDYLDLSLLFLYFQILLLRLYYSFRFPYGTFERLIKMFPILNLLTFKKEKTEPSSKTKDRFVEPAWSLVLISITFNFSFIALLAYFRMDKLFAYTPSFISQYISPFITKLCAFVICQGNVTFISRNSQFATLIRILGLIIFQASVILFTWVHKVMRTNWTPVVCLRKDHTLVTEGPFQIVRHPMYLSIFLMEVGMGLMSWNWLLFIFGCSSFMPFIFSRIPIEDKLLLETFGNQFTKYSTSVKYAIIPYIY